MTQCGALRSIEPPSWSVLPNRRGRFRHHPSESTFLRGATLWSACSRQARGLRRSDSTRGPHEPPRDGNHRILAHRPVRLPRSRLLPLRDRHAERGARLGRLHDARWRRRDALHEPRRDVPAREARAPGGRPVALRKLHLLARAGDDPLRRQRWERRGLPPRRQPLLRGRRLPEGSRRPGRGPVLRLGGAVRPGLGGALLRPEGDAHRGELPPHRLVQESTTGSRWAGA